MTKQSSVSKLKTCHCDYLRDTVLRYLGLANEVGEATRYIFPKFLRPSYMIAFGYVFTDAFDKARHQYLLNKNKANKKRKIFTAFMDCLIW